MGPACGRGCLIPQKGSIRTGPHPGLVLLGHIGGAVRGRARAHTRGQTCESWRIRSFDISKHTRCRSGCLVDGVEHVHGDMLEVFMIVDVS